MVKVAVLKQAAWRQLILSPEFSADTNWTHTGTVPWTISGGKGNAVGITTEELKQAVDPLTSGVDYFYSIIVTATVGKVAVVMGTTVVGILTAGTYLNQSGTANGTNFTLRAATIAEGGTGTFTGTVDDVYCIPQKETFISSGFGTPKAAMFILSAGYENDVDASGSFGASFGQGITDGTRNYCIMGGSEHGAADSDTYRRISNTVCAGLISANDGTAMVAGAWSSWPTDGVEILWSTFVYQTFPPILTIILFGGDDLTAYAGDFTSNAAEDGTVDVTPGFEPEQVIVLTTGSTTAFGTTGNGLKLGVGFVNNAGGGVITNASLNMFSTDASASSLVKNHLSTSYAVLQPGPGAGISLQAFQSSSPQFQAMTAGVGGAAIHAYLALKYNGTVEHWVGVVDAPTDFAGEFTGANMKPQFVLQCPSAATILDTDIGTNDTGAGSWSVSAFDASIANTVAIRDATGRATTDTISRTSAKAVRTTLGWEGGGGSPVHIATFVSFDTYGWTLNYDDTDATQRYWPALTIGEFVPASTGNFFQMF